MEKSAAHYRHQFDSEIIPIRHFFPSSSSCMLRNITHLGFVSKSATSFYFYFAIHPNVESQNLNNSAIKQGGISQVYRIHLPSSSQSGRVESLRKPIDLSRGLRYMHFVTDPKSAYFYCMANEKAAAMEEADNMRHQSTQSTKQPLPISSQKELVRFSSTTFRRESFPILGGDSIPDEAPYEQAFLSQHLKFISMDCLLFVRTENSHPELWPLVYERFERKCYSSIVFLLHIDELNKCIIPSKICLPELPTRFFEPCELQGPMDRRWIELDWTIRSSTFFCDCDQMEKQGHVEIETEKCCLCYHFPSISIKKEDCPSFTTGKDEELLLMMQKSCFFNLDLSNQLVIFNWQASKWDKFQINPMKNQKPMDDQIHDLPICFDHGFCCFLKEQGRNGMLYRLNIDAKRNEYWFTALFRCGYLRIYADQFGRIILNWEWLNNFVEIINIGRPPSLKSLAFWQNILKNEEKNEKIREILEEKIGDIKNFAKNLIILNNNCEQENGGTIRIAPTWTEIVEFLKMHKFK